MLKIKEGRKFEGKGKYGTIRSCIAGVKSLNRLMTVFLRLKKSPIFKFLEFIYYLGGEEYIWGSERHSGF